MSKYEHSPYEVTGGAMDSLKETPVAKRAATLNTQTRVLQTYKQHRRKTMELVSLAAAALDDVAERTISVLGAGNCMDLDLPQLVTLFHKVTLLDLDREAVESGVNTVECLQTARVQIQAPVDLAFPLTTISAASLSGVDSIADLCQQLANPLAAPPAAPADVVVSTCVLSQMLNALTHFVTEKDAQFLPLVQAVRRGHLVRMLQLLKPGGRGILITDLVSSETTPALTSINDASLPKLLAQALATGNFFSGLHPGVMLQDLETQPGIAPYVDSPTMTTPWRWEMGPRVYAVFAITFRKR